MRKRIRLVEWDECEVKLSGVADGGAESKAIDGDR